MVEIKEGNMNIALVSPNKKSYSETFIQAQKNGLMGKVFYYYDGFIPKKLEGNGSILIKRGSVKKRLGLVFKDVVSESFLKSLKENKIDVVLAQYGPTGEAIADICEKAGIPLVTHFHGYDASIFAIIKKHNNYCNAFRVSKYIIAVSKTMAEDLKDLGCPASKIVYNPCAPESVFFQIKPTFEKKQFLAMGRFTDKKAPYYTLMAFKQVFKEFPEAKLIFLGDGELLNTCKNIAKYLGLEHAVKFEGASSRDEVLDYMKSSYAFVQHSIEATNGDKEGTPVAIMEAGASGLPVIATAHAGINDIVVDRKTGLLSKEHDVGKMVENMLELLKDPELAKQLGNEAKSYIFENYNMNIHLNKLQSLLENSCKKI